MNIDCERIDWENIFIAPDFSDCFQDLTVIGKVVSVYDGDSVKVIMPFQNRLYRFSSRLSGIDTPEIRSSCPLEKELAIKIRDLLSKKILNKLVIIKCKGLDKYGRLLVTLHMDGDEKTINEWLIDENYAFEYNGNKKKSWSEFLKPKLK